jgi:hypothetical protein
LGDIKNTMTKRVKIVAFDGTVEILENEIDKYTTLTALISSFKKPPKILRINVNNYSVEYYNAVVEYTRNIAMTSVEHEYNADTIAHFTPGEAHIADRFLSKEDAIMFFGAAHYLGNTACIKFAARTIIRHIIVWGLYNNDQLVSQNLICESDTK